MVNFPDRFVSLLIEELLLPDISGIDLYRSLKPDSWSYMTIGHI